mgnify:CR=1 FL=1
MYWLPYTCPTQPPPFDGAAVAESAAGCVTSSVVVTVPVLALAASAGVKAALSV